MRNGFPVKISVSTDTDDPRIVFLGLEAELENGENPLSKRKKMDRIFALINLIALSLKAKTIDPCKEKPFPKAFEREIAFFSWYKFDSLENEIAFLQMVNNVE